MSEPNRPYTLTDAGIVGLLPDPVPLEFARESLMELLNLAYTHGRTDGVEKCGQIVSDGFKQISEGAVALDVALSRAIAAAETVDLPPEDPDATPCPDCHRKHSPLVQCSTQRLAAQVHDREHTIPPVKLGQGDFETNWPRNRGRVEEQD